MQDLIHFPTLKYIVQRVFSQKALLPHSTFVKPVQSVLLPVGGPSATTAGALGRDARRKAGGRINSDCVLPWTAELEHVPVKDVIVGEALLVE